MLQWTFFTSTHPWLKIVLATFANDVGTQSLCSDFSQVRNAADLVHMGNNFLNASHRVHSVSYNLFTTVQLVEFLPP